MYAPMSAAESAPRWNLTVMRWFNCRSSGVAISRRSSGWPIEDDLEQFHGGGLQIPQQPHFLEHVPGQVLGLVHDQDRVAPFLLALKQEALDRLDQLDLGPLCPLDVELLAGRLKELLGRQGAMDDHGRIHPVAEFLQRRAAEHALAGADFAGDQGEALALLDRIDQAGQRLAVLRARIIKARIRRGAERETSSARNVQGTQLPRLQ